MYQITIQKKDQDGNKVTITKSLYPKIQQAQRAMITLRLLSKDWTKSIQDLNCIRPNAKPPTWKLHNYSVTKPTEIRVN